MSDEVRIYCYKPHQLGWLKRSDLGDGTWEMPDGRLWRFAPEDKAQSLIVWADPLIGCPAEDMAPWRLAA